MRADNDDGWFLRRKRYAALGCWASLWAVVITAAVVVILAL